LGTGLLHGKITGFNAVLDGGVALYHFSSYDNCAQIGGIKLQKITGNSKFIFRVGRRSPGLLRQVIPIPVGGQDDGSCFLSAEHLGIW